MRGQRLSTKSITVFINTNRFKNPNFYYNEASCSLKTSTNDTRKLVHTTLLCLESIWEKDRQYVKAGIVLNDLAAGTEQEDLFTESQSEASLKLMNTIDALNRSYGHVINLAAQGKDKEWSMRREKLSPSYTTKWAEIKRVD